MSRQVEWNSIPAWSAVNEKHRTPNLAALDQGILNRDGWQSGNAVTLIINGSGARKGEPYNGESAAAPLLQVEYSTGGTPADTTASEVTISTPMSGASYNTTTASVNFGGTSSEDTSVVQVSWANARGGSGTAFETAN